jgi:phosphate:Na+ symporter
MSPLNALIFGLGLFFLGLRLVGDNLKGLAGGSLKSGFSSSTHNPVLGSGLGLLAGALMQSATAVTFICVSMVAAGLLTTASASFVILWCNVGLTALAFLATLNIHPIVALVVGGAGIVMGVIRNRSWQTAAGVFLGIGLILLGLQQMGEGAAPLKNEAWFRSGIDFAVSSPPMAFLAGILAAAVLQSNTGATMMVITLAGAGALDFSDAALMIYGTNLGAIALRFILATGMKGDGLRLVRLEDLFCLWSGLLMLVLFYIESAGVPLVFALAHSISPAPQQGLAVVFTLSNLIPALTMLPFLRQWWKLLEHLWPGNPPQTPGRPKFLSPQALDHPSVALELLRHELANLLSLLASAMGKNCPPRKPEDDSEEPSAAFVRLAGAIESFSVKLASQQQLSEQQTAQLQRLRAGLSGIRHLEEGVRFYLNRCARIPTLAPAAKETLGGTLSGFFDRATHALDQGDVGALKALLEESKRHGPALEKIRSEVNPPDSVASNVEFPALMEDFELVAWTFHRILKILVRLPAETGRVAASAKSE